MALVELNLSCPNVEHRGEVFATDPAAAAEVVRAVKQATSTPVLAKLTADVTDLVAVARAVVDAGADGLTLINTLLGMAVDVGRRRPRLAAVTGGLSGPAIRPVAVRCVWQVAQALPGVPIVGTGGVVTGEDAAELLLVGATAVAVGTGSFSTLERWSRSPTASSATSTPRAPGRRPSSRRCSRPSADRVPGSGEAVPSVTGRG